MLGIAWWSQTYGEIPCRADLIFPYSCPTVRFESDELSVMLLIGFYQPSFRGVPVRGSVAVARA